MRYVLLTLLIALGCAPATAQPLTFEPANESTVHEFRPVISVSLPGKSEYVHDAARLWVDGKEVSGSCLRTPMFVSYQPMSEMKKGSVRVRFTIPVVGKEPTELRWTFKVDPTGRIKRVSYTHDGGDQLQEYDELTVTMEAETGGEAWFTIERIQGKHELKEIEEGIYQGTYLVKPGDYAMGAKVKAYLTFGPKTEEKEADQDIVIFGHLFRVKIYEPADGSEVETQFKIRGRTRPDCKVILVPNIGFNDNMAAPNSSNVNTATGQAAGGTTGSIETNADANGFFEFNYGVPLRLPNMRVVMNIYAVDPEGERSVPRIMRYKF